jgi:hypothetical protein
MFPLFLALPMSTPDIIKLFETQIYLYIHTNPLFSYFVFQQFSINPTRREFLFIRFVSNSGCFQSSDPGVTLTIPIRDDGRYKLDIDIIYRR